MGGRTVYMLGYGGRSLQETLDLVRMSGARVVADIRRWAWSRRAPEFSRQNLERALAGVGARYVHVPSLGGYRVFGRDAVDKGWFRCYRSEGFRAYATYLLTRREAQAGLETLWYSVPAGLLVLCRERIPWRCHRKVVADWLALHNIKVIHIIDNKNIIEHSGTRCIDEMARLLGLKGPKRSIEEMLRNGPRRDHATTLNASREARLEGSE